MKSLIGDKKFYRMVLIVCIPIVIQNGFTNLASLLDNVMIGQLGTLSMSGVSISNQLFQVFNVSVWCKVRCWNILGTILWTWKQGWCTQLFPN